MALHITDEGNMNKYKSVNQILAFWTYCPNLLIVTSPYGYVS